ncbi:MAG: membrane lipoprotein lipid attachment site-containing protein [Myxococcota bacterium]
MATEKALRLHGYRAMKRITVGIVAVLALAGCGVGVDDPEGQAAVGTVQSALMTTEGGGQTPVVVSPVPVGSRALPQDPDPIFPVSSPSRSKPSLF